MHLYFVCVTPAEPQPRPGVGQDERIWLLAGQSASEGGQPGGRTLLWPPAPEVSTAGRRHAASLFCLFLVMISG